MSWFQDLAGKAEGLLNQLDQSAATALQKDLNRQGTPKHGHSGAQRSETGGSAQYSGSLAAQEQPHHSLSSFVSDSPRRDVRSSGYASSVSSLRERVQAKEEDEKLMDFLNEPSGERPKTAPLSRKSSSSSILSLPSQTFRSLLSEPEAGAAQRSDEALPAAPGEFRVKPLIEQELIELRSREADFQKALQAKDSQLAVLRVRLQEGDHQLQLKTQQLQKLEKENERLLKDTAQSSSFRNQAMDTLQAKLREAESALEIEAQSAKKAEAEFLARIQKLEDERAHLSRDLVTWQKATTDEKLTCKEALDQLKLAKYNLEANKQEFDEYKNKAQKILQSKEKLIAALKTEGSGGAAADQSHPMVELEELRSERDMLKEDLQQNHLQLYNLRADMQELESQLAAEQRSSLEQQRQLQEQCQSYQSTAAQYREQYEHLKQEYQFVQDELRRQQMALQARLQEKDTEIARLSVQLTAKSASPSPETELEARIRMLTENLIQKQTTIEALQTEKHSLALQLERTEKLYREAESAAIRSSSSTAVSVGYGDEGVHSRVPAFLRETPHDTGVARSVKKAYTTLDSLSVKVGVFLRRYPTARVFVFLYMILLHFWVMVVLLTYTPEIHSSDSRTTPL